MTTNERQTEQRGLTAEETAVALCGLWLEPIAGSEAWVADGILWVPEDCDDAARERACSRALLLYLLAP